MTDQADQSENVLAVYNPIDYEVKEYGRLISKCNGERFTIFNSPKELLEDKTIEFSKALVTVVSKDITMNEDVLQKVLRAKLKAGMFKSLANMVKEKNGVTS